MQQSNQNVGKLVGLAILGLIILILLLGSFTIVSAGQKGIILRVGKVDRILDSGIHFKVPLVEGVKKISVQTLKEQIETDAASQDLQTVKAIIAVNYNVDPSKVADLWNTVGEDYKSRIIDPAIQEAVKAATAKYTAEQLITQRPQVKEDILLSLKTILSPKDIMVSDVSITNFDFSPSFNSAIEAKVTAEQQALQAKNKLDQVKYEAEQTIAKATAEAKAIQIQAEAITQQGGTNYVLLQMANKWDGKGCTQSCFGQNTQTPVPFFNLNK